MGEWRPVHMFYHQALANMAPTENGHGLLVHVLTLLVMRECFLIRTVYETYSSWTPPAIIERQLRSIAELLGTPGYAALHNLCSASGVVDNPEVLCTC